MLQMRHCILAATALFLVSLGACAAPFSASPDEASTPEVGAGGVDPAGQPMGPHGQPEPGETGAAGDPPMLGVHYARGGGGGPPTVGGGSSPNLTSHGGQIMTSSSITPIFWGKKWNDATNYPDFTADKISGLATLYGGLAGSAYASSNDEYTGTNGQVSTAVGTIAVYDAIVDNSAAPSRAPKTSAIAAEVCKRIASPVADGYYPVYTDTRRGSAGYCAWHSYTTCNNVPVQFAFFFDLDGDSGCDPQDTGTDHSQGLAALANVSGHEWSEMMTDPRNGGWWDSSGNENADKCAWSFGSPVTLSDGSVWKIQGNWSNAAYDTKSGYPTSAKMGSLNGCLPL